MVVPIKQRIKAIDQFRGFAIILMVVFNYGMEVQTLPTWMKHVPDVGMNFADLGTPVFVFAIGLTYGLSFRRRAERDGIPATFGHFTRRYLAILGMGAILSAGQTMIGRNTSGVDWGVLQAIGAAGLLTLLVIQLPTRVRLVIGLGLLAFYQIMLDTYWLEVVLRSPHGGFPGSLSWAAILIIATVFGDLYHQEDSRKFFIIVSLFSLLSGVVLSYFVPLSKNRVSAPYDLITLGFSGLIFSIFYLTNFELDYFVAWGRNPLLLYTLSLLLTGIFVLPDIPVWHKQAPIWLVGIQALALVLILGSLARYWQKKGFIFSI
jgi:predicted acyltransferase